MQTYCCHVGIDIRSVRFMYDGNSMSPSDTPESLGMEDCDIIDAFLAQIGGDWKSCGTGCVN